MYNNYFNTTITDCTSLCRPSVLNGASISRACNAAFLTGILSSLVRRRNIDIIELSNGSPTKTQYDHEE